MRLQLPFHVGALSNKLQEEAAGIFQAMHEIIPLWELVKEQLLTNTVISYQLSLIWHSWRLVRTVGMVSRPPHSKSGPSTTCAA